MNYQSLFSGKKIVLFFFVFFVFFYKILSAENFTQHAKLNEKKSISNVYKIPSVE